MPQLVCRFPLNLQSLKALGSRCLHLAAELLEVVNDVPPHMQGLLLQDLSFFGGKECYLDWSLHWKIFS